MLSRGILHPSTRVALFGNHLNVLGADVVPLLVSGQQTDEFYVMKQTLSDCRCSFGSIFRHLQLETYSSLLHIVSSNHWLASRSDRADVTFDNKVAVLVLLFTIHKNWANSGHANCCKGQIRL
jgi:hypothetical protein